MTIVYLAGPIDRANPATALGWVNQLMSAMSEVKTNPPVVLYSPQMAFSVHGGTDVSVDDSSNIWWINRAALENSDLMVVRYIEGVVSWGTPQELGHAATYNKDIVLFTDVARTLVSLPVYIKAHEYQLVTHDVLAVAAYLCAWRGDAK